MFPHKKWRDGRMTFHPADTKPHATKQVKLTQFLFSRFIKQAELRQQKLMVINQAPKVRLH